MESTGKALVESGVVPDFVTRMGIKYLLGKTSQSLKRPTVQEQEAAKRDYIMALKQRDIAYNTKEANEQHYEVPTEFFDLCLGPHKKYSCCLFDNTNDLAEAELKMLELYTQRAQIQDGMSILELGCGWGSLSLFLAQKYPNSRILGISNSKTQREYIMQRAELLGLTNLEIQTHDANELQMDRQFDRIMTIEMFEHMKNYSELLNRVGSWLVPETGRLFIHVFCHRDMPYGILI
jgi:cyclopropane fatty-acyl-phospholipid synthase-like methyltransferase